MQAHTGQGGVVGHGDGAAEHGLIVIKGPQSLVGQQGHGDGQVGGGAVPLEDHDLGAIHGTCRSYGVGQGVEGVELGTAAARGGVIFDKEPAFSNLHRNCGGGTAGGIGEGIGESVDQVGGIEWGGVGELAIGGDRDRRSLGARILKGRHRGAVGIVVAEQLGLQLAIAQYLKCVIDGGGRQQHKSAKSIRIATTAHGEQSRSQCDDLECLVHTGPPLNSEAFFKAPRSLFEIALGF